MGALLESSVLFNIRYMENTHVFDNISWCSIIDSLLHSGFHTKYGSKRELGNTIFATDSVIAWQKFKVVETFSARCIIAASKPVSYINNIQFVHHSITHRLAWSPLYTSTLVHQRRLDMFT